MNAIYAAALEIQEFIQKNTWRFCIIGGLAVVRWGQPRATQDVDISLLAGFGREQEIVDCLLSRFGARFRESREVALQGRVLLTKASNGVPLDIALAAFPYEERVIDRASTFAFAPDVVLRTASAEDMVVLKAFAARDQDWVDVKGIVEKQIDRLSWDYVFRELTTLCNIKEDHSPVERLSTIRQTVGEGC